MYAYQFDLIRSYVLASIQAVVLYIRYDIPVVYYILSPSLAARDSDKYTIQSVTHSFPLAIVIKLIHQLKGL